jgi:hypothetical protein
MPSRLIPLLALAVALYATGAIIVSLSPLADASRSAAVAPAAAPAALPVLPTVVVHPEPEVPVLALVTVRPERAGAIGAEASKPVPVAALAVRAASVAVLPSGGFDMPYYSFGRTARRVNKE